MFKPNIPIVVRPVFALVVLAGIASPVTAHEGFVSATSYPEGGQLRHFAIDDFGNFVLAGHFSDAIDYGSGSILRTGPFRDVFVVKLDAAANHVWSRSFASTGNNLDISDVAADSSGNIIVVGEFEESVNFGGALLQGSSTTTGTDTISYFATIFIAKFTSAGDHIWSRAFTGNGAAHVNAVAVDGNGAAVVTGSFDGTLNFGGQAFTSMAFDDYFVAKFDGAGNHLWSKAVIGDAPNAGTDVDADAAGNIVVTGKVGGGSDFGGGPTNPAGIREIFLVKYNGAGDYLWDTTFQTISLDDVAASVAFDGSGDIVTTGSFGSIIDLGGGDRITVGGKDVYLVKYGGGGNYLWSRTFGTAGDDSGRGVETNAADNIVLLGQLDFTTTIGDRFMMEFDAAGIPIWTDTFQDADNVTPFDIALNDLEITTIAGIFSGTFDFPGTTMGPDGGTFLARFSGTGLDPSIQRSPASLAPSVIEGLDADADTIKVSNSGGGILGYSLEANAGWLSFSPAAGSSTGETVSHTVVYDTAALAPGTYPATIRIPAYHASNGTQTIAVTLTVEPKPQFAVSPTSLMQSIVEGDTAPSQTFDVTNVGGATLNYTIDVSGGVWLHVDPAMPGLAAGQTNTQTVTYETAALLPGNYNETITLTETLTGHTFPIPVSLTVQAPARIGVVPVSFSGTIFEGQNPMNDLLTVMNLGEAPLSYSLSTDVNWLGIGPVGGTLGAGAALGHTLGYDAALLSEGSYFANVCITGNAVNSPVCVPVTLSVLPTPEPRVAGAPGGGAHVFSAAFGGPGFDGGEGVAIDSSGNVVLAGVMEGGIDLGGGPLDGTGFLAKFDSAGNPIWSKGVTAEFYDVATDSLDNIIVTGTFDTPTDFGAGLAIPNGVSIVVIKYDDAGHFLWFRSFDGPVSASSFGVDVDALDNIAIIGTLVDEIFDHNILVANFTKTGVTRWSRTFGGAGVNDGNSVSFDAFGNTLITGAFESSIDFGGGPLSPGGQTDIFIASYDELGNHRWSRRIGGAGFDAGWGIAGDPFGNVLATGSFEASVDFGAGPVLSSGASDVFIAKYDADGSHVWSKTAGAADFDTGIGVATDALGNVAATGVFADSVNFGSGPLSAAGTFDVFVAAYDSDGVPVWSGAFGNIGSDFGIGAAIDGSGAVYVAGSFEDSIDFGGGPLGGLRTADGNRGDVFLVKMNGAFPGTSPALALSPTSLGANAIEGSSPPSQSFVVVNSGGGTIGYTISDDASWLNVAPTSGSVAGESDTIAVTYAASALAAGVYHAVIHVADTGGGSHEVAVTLTIAGAATGGTGGSSGGGGCFIATAAYGTPLADEIRVLRRFRDEYLLTNAAGVAFADAYYRLSPPLANLAARNRSARRILRLALYPIVGMLRGLSAPGLIAFTIAIGAAGTRRTRLACRPRNQSRETRII